MFNTDSVQVETNKVLQKIFNTGVISSGDTKRKIFLDMVREYHLATRLK